MSQLQKRGINAYFSGCITLTLPKMPKKKIEKEYICVVDCEAKVRNKIKKILEGSNIEVKVVTHQGERNPERSWEDREKKVIELLTLYRNAKCVVTKRLHCALPCLAQETPVLLVKEMVDDIRFSPYYDFLHWTTVTNFMNNNYEYDFINPPQNKTNYKHVREDLEKSCIGFIEKMEKETGSVDELNRFNCTDKEIHEWQFNLMDETLHKWLYKTRADSKETRKLRKEIERLKKENEKMKKENEKLLRIVNSKTVRYARKIRKVIRG